jgi:inosine/xanthosine triphosphatase
MSARPVQEEFMTTQRTSVSNIAVGSINPVKIAAVRLAVATIWPDAAIAGTAVDPGISRQPMSDDEAIAGATNRAHLALAATGADLGIGIEGNTVDCTHGMFVTAWTVIVDEKKRTGIGSGGRFLLPEAVAAGVRGGHELGPLMDEFIDEENTKQRQGAVGILTGGLISRTEALRSSVVYALTRFITPQYYHRSGSR